VAGCTDTRVLQTVLSVTSPTAVTLIPPVNTALTTVCPSDATRVLNYTFSTVPTGVSLASVTVASSTANGGTGPACSLATSVNGEVEVFLGTTWGWKLLACCHTCGLVLARMGSGGLLMRWERLESLGPLTLFTRGGGHLLGNGTNWRCL
jgi:hypothetical protein